MAQKRIKMVRTNIINDRIQILYDDDSHGEIDMAKAKNPCTSTDTAVALLVGLTLKQAKMKLGIKN